MDKKVQKIERAAFPYQESFANNKDFSELLSLYTKTTPKQDKVEVNELYTLMYSFGFKHNFKTFISKWRDFDTNNMDSKSLKQMTIDLLTEIERELLAKEHVSGHEWF